MTGFGQASGVVGGIQVSIEVNGVNRKNLDFQCSLPRDWQGLEPLITEAVRDSVGRGKVNLQVQAASVALDTGLAWDPEILGVALNRLRETASAHEIRFEPDADFLLRLLSMVGREPSLPEAGLVRDGVMALVAEALRLFCAMRGVEGQAILADLMERAGLIEMHLERIRSLAETTVPRYRELLFQRLRKLGLELDLDDERVLKEVAIFADRCDTSEEMTRLASHLAQFRTVAGQPGPVGRKLDFLCQEMFREINTTGAKANNIEITQHVLEMKNEMERIREQVQNVE